MSVDADQPHGNEPDLLAGMVNGEWLDDQHFPPLSFAVPALVPEGFGVLVGPPKIGKSWLVANIGLAVASGGEALGAIDVARRPVLYLALEDGHRRLQERFRRIMAGQALPKEIYVINEIQAWQGVGTIEAFLFRHRCQQPLVILDTLGRVRPPRRASDDSYGEDYALGSRLKRLVDAIQGSTLLVVHHTRKALSEDFVDAVSGTHGLAGSADFVLVLSRKRHSEEAILSVTGRDISENSYALVADDGMVWRLDGASLEKATEMVDARRNEVELGDRSLEVVALVNSRDETRAADLAHLGIDAGQASVYLTRLEKSGRIQRIKRGAYGPCVGSVRSVSSTDDQSGQPDTPNSPNTPHQLEVASPRPTPENLPPGSGDLTPHTVRLFPPRQDFLSIPRSD